MITMLQDQTLDEKGLKAEREIIETETRCILEKVIQAGNGDLVRGIVRSFQAGILDIPFAPSKFNAGKMLPARDNEGCVRIFHPGTLPFTPDLLRFHKQKMEERAAYENREPSFQMVIDDIYAISKGRLVGRPR